MKVRVFLWVGLWIGLGVAWLATPVRAQEAYDFLLKGGHVIDSKNGIDGIRDVAIKNGKIAKVAPDISTELTWNIVPIKGLYVVPGLIDIHVHVFCGPGQGYMSGDSSVFPDAHSFRSGVTTVVDAGSSGAKNFSEFRQRIISRSKTRVLAFLNIVAGGMAGRGEQDVEDMNPEACAATIKKYPKDIVGVKTAHYNGPEWVAVERAVEAGKLANVPVMVDFGTFRSERPYQQLVLEKLRPGDISTHFYHRPVPFFDGEGKLLPYLQEARKRGVKFDVGHGGASFVWKNALPAVKQGMVADSISTDLHAESMVKGMKDMNNVMSKFLSMDVPFQEVVQMSTWTPAELIHRTELGHLSEGAVADVAVLALREGTFGFIDVRNGRRLGKQKIETEMTFRGGEVMWDLNGRAGYRYNDPK